MEHCTSASSSSNTCRVKTWWSVMMMPLFSSDQWVLKTHLVLGIDMQKDIRHSLCATTYSFILFPVSKSQSCHAPTGFHSFLSVSFYHSASLLFLSLLFFNVPLPLYFCRFLCPHVTAWKVYSVVYTYRGHRCLISRVK